MDSVLLFSTLYPLPLLFPYSGTLAFKYLLNSSYQIKDAEGQQVFGIASGTPLEVAWKGLVAASVQGPKHLDALESMAKARLLEDG